MIENFFSILSLIIGGVLSLGGIIVFYKANRKKAYAEARNQEIKNMSEVQETYQKLLADVQKTSENLIIEVQGTSQKMILDLKTQVFDLTAKVDKLETKITTMCDNCRYKRYYNEHEKK